MTNSNKKRIVIFDMDGVLFDTIPYARQMFMKTHPGVTEEVYNEIHSGNFYQEASKYAHLKIKESAEEENKRKLEYAEKKSKQKIIGGIKDLLVELHNSGYTLVLNSNTHNRNCLPLLENGGISTLFDFIASAEVSKDKVKKFKLIQNKYGADKKDVVFITDALGDVRDADTASVPTIAVTWGVHSKDFFEHEDHKNLISIVENINGLLGSIKNRF